MKNFVTVKLYKSLFKSKSNTYHIDISLQECGHFLSYYLPTYANKNSLISIVNGKYIPLEKYDVVKLKKHDELIIKVLPGFVESLVTALIYAAISLVISLAISAIMYFAFPPKKPQLRTPKDEVAYSWDGITTTQGPGNVVPVVYGEAKLGGQLLQAFYTQQPTVGGYGGIPLVNPKPLLQVLLALCEGEIEDVLIDTLTVNNQPINNFPQISVQKSLGENPNILQFGEIQNTFSTSNTEISLTPFIYTTTQDVDAVVLNIQFLEGLFTIGSNGGSSPNTSVFQYRTRFSPAGAWTTYTEVHTTLEVHSIGYKPVRIEFTSPVVTSPNTYDIELTFVTAQYMSNTRSKWKPYLNSVTEILYETQSFPNTALLYTSALAQENLQGALPNFQVIVQGLKVRENSFTAPKTYSDNPAWCLMDLMTNTRYAAAIEDTEINLASFIAFANYCDELVDFDTDGDGDSDGTEKRAILSYVLDSDRQAIDVFEELLSGTRGVLVKSEGQWKIKIAKNDTPVQLVTWANTLRDSVLIRYIRDIDSINVLEGRYLNAYNAYENDVETYPEHADWPNVVKKLSLEFKGVSRNTQVLRELFFELRARTLPKFTIEFLIPLEGIVFEVMDIINFTYPQFTESISGRIAEKYGDEVNTVRQFIIDEDFTFEVGESYIGIIKYPNDTLQTIILDNPATSTDVTTRRIELDVGDPDLNFIPTALETLYSIGNQTEVLTYPVRVTDISKDSEFTVRVQGVQHVPEIYDDYLAYSNVNRLGARPFQVGTRPPPIISLFATEQLTFDDSTLTTTQILREVMLLEWQVAAIDSNPNEVYAPYGGVNIYSAFSNFTSLLGTFNLGTTLLGGFDSLTTSLNLIATIRNGDVYSYKDAQYNKNGPTLYIVVPISPAGVPNNEGVGTVLVTPTGGFFAPPDDFLATGDSPTTVTLTWNDTTDPRLDSVNIYRGTAFSSAIFLINVAIGVETYVDTGLTPLTTYTYWAVSVQTNGNLGSETSSTTTTL